MLSPFSFCTRPTSENVGGLIAQAARFTQLVQPYYALCEMRRDMLDCHTQFWQQCSMPQVVDCL